MSNQIVEMLNSYIISNVYPISIKDLIKSIIMVLIGFVVLLSLKGKIESPLLFYLAIISFMMRYIGNCIRFFDMTTGTYVKHVATICLGISVIFCYFFYIIKYVQSIYLRLGAVAFGIAAIAHLLDLTMLRNICMYAIVLIVIIKMIIVFKER